MEKVTIFGQNIHRCLVGYNKIMILNFFDRFTMSKVERMWILKDLTNPINFVLDIDFLTIYSIKLYIPTSCNNSSCLL